MNQTLPYYLRCKCIKVLSIGDTIAIPPRALLIEFKWTLYGQTFLTPAGELVDAMKAAIKTVCGFDTELSTTGGTSDGRFIAPTGAQVVELGPLNATIHKVNECVGVDELDTLSEVYEQILFKLLVD